MNIYDFILNEQVDTQIYTGILSSLSPLKFKLYTYDTEIPCKSVTSLLGAKVNSNIILMKINNQFIIIAVLDDITTVESSITAINSVNTAQSTAISTINSVNTVQDTSISTINSVNTVQDTSISTINSVNTTQSTAISTATSNITQLQSRLRFLKKSSSTSRSETTSLAADPHLTVSLSANTTYHVTAVLGVSGDHLYRFKNDWTVNGTLAFDTLVFAIGAGWSTTDVYVSPVTNFTAHAYNYANGYGCVQADIATIRQSFIVSGNGSGGTLTMRWAQEASGAVDTILDSSSYLIIDEIVTV